MGTEPESRSAPRLMRSLYQHITILLCPIRSHLAGIREEKIDSRLYKVMDLITKKEYSFARNLRGPRSPTHDLRDSLWPLSHCDSLLTSSIEKEKHAMTIQPIHFSNGVTKTPTRMIIRRCGEYLNRYALYWDFGDDSCVTVEGYCSRPEFRLARQARAYALRKFGEKAVLSRD